MNALTLALTVVETLTKFAPQFVTTWSDLKPFATTLFEQFKGAQISADELVELEAKIDELAARLQEPLPEP